MSQLTLYKASAGSGKTFTLVFSYLKLALDPANPFAFQRILAITFTNKATEEMKNRILRELSDMAKGEETAMKSALAEYFQEKGVEIHLQKQANRVFEAILNDYNHFSISTIESFFQKILRAFAKELGIPLGFEIEMDTESVLRVATDAILLDVGKNSEQELSELVKRFVQHKMQGEKGWKVEESLQKIGGQVFTEKFARWHNQIKAEGINSFEKITEMIHYAEKEKERIEVELKRRAKELFQNVPSGLEMEDFYFGKNGPFGVFAKWIEGDFSSLKIARINDVREKEDLSLGSAKLKKKDSIAFKSLENNSAYLASLLFGADDYLEEELANYRTAEMILEQIHIFALLPILDKKYRSILGRQRQMHISNAGPHLLGMIDDLYAPFIYEKVGLSYDYYLIDEFQDTSEMQWDNLFPLLLESLSKTTRDGNLLVGDVKQAIYRFRGGDWSLMQHKVREYVEAVTGSDLLEKNLSYNYRTAAPIVEFNNQFFIEAARLLSEEITDEEETLVGAYSEVAQIPFRKEEAGYVHLEILDDEQKNGVEEWAMERTLDVITDLHHEKGYKYSDITLLVNTNWQAVKIASFLQNNRVQVTSAESLLLESHPGIRLLISLLQWISEEESSIASAEVIRNYYAISGEEFEHNYDKKAVETLLKNIVSDPQTLIRLPLFECVSRLQRLHPFLQEANAYTQGFLDVVLDFSGRKDGGISEFLRYWEEKKANLCIISAENPNAVKIMTIHKSKGLEFPICIIPFCDWKFSPKSNLIWIDTQNAPKPYNSLPALLLTHKKDLAETLFSTAYHSEIRDSFVEQLNKLYVAFTRPQYGLYAFFAPIKMGQKKSKLESNTVSRLVYNIFEEEWQEEENSRLYTQGRMPHISELKKVHIPQEETPLQADYAIVEDWNELIKIRTHANRFVRSKILTQMEKVNEGNLYHSALESIKTIHDVGEAVKKLVLKGELAQEYKSEFESRLYAIVNQPQAKKWFSGEWEVRNEREILLPDGHAYRPDRVLLRGDSAIIIDYKSGDAKQSHDAQITQYAQALKQMGYSKVEGYLYFLREMQIQEVAV